ncbi:MAG: pyruvate ferredoxin oxidoreductase subunit gamma [Candidatus Anammoxibacter sp.]
MIEIRIHGRGGQGSVTAAELVGYAAYSDGKHAQAFPSFGSERMGAPVQAFARISDKQIRLRSQVYNPDYIIVQDPTLLSVIDVFSGMKKKGLVIINSKKKPSEFKKGSSAAASATIMTIPAAEIAMEILGRPIMNTTLLGAFSAASKAISLEGIQKALCNKFSQDIADKNFQAAQKAYDYILEHSGKSAEK